MRFYVSFEGTCGEYYNTYEAALKAFDGMMRAAIEGGVEGFGSITIVEDEDSEV